MPDMAGANTLTLSDATFDQEVLHSEVPVLVDFWAAWCGPCRVLAPTVEAIAGEFAGSLKVGKLDLDQNMNTAARFRVQNIPTLLLFKNGQLVDGRVGLVPRSEILKMVLPHVGKEITGAQG
jgi:thioredoxin 1